MRKPTTRPGGKRESKRIWQFQDQWLGREAGSPYFYRYFYIGDERVGRKSLGVTDLEAAKVLLVKAVLGDAPEDPLSPDQVYFQAVMRYYLDNHAIKIRAQGAAKRAVDLALSYLKTATGKASPNVNDFGLARQEAFMRWCRDEHGLTAKSITTYLSTIRAAMTYAARPRIITDSKGIEREGRMLSTPYYIEASQKEVVRVTGLPPSRPREFIPTDAQVAAFIDAIYNEADETETRDREHIFRYVIIALNLWARPEAICELNVAKQVDFANGLVHLNPPGRTQNRKYRPTVRLTDNLRGWLLHWNRERPIMYLDQPVDQILPRTFKKIAARAGVPGLVQYSLRHYSNTRAMRVAPDIRPDREERAIWMGHFDPRHKTTMTYEHMDPEYLVRAMKATDAIMVALDTLCRKSLFAPGTVRPGLHVIEKRA